MPVTTALVFLLASAGVPLDSGNGMASHHDHALGAPVRLEAEGGPIDVTTGHAAPYVIDFDGDGVRDLLVGEFGTGQFDINRLPENRRQDGKAEYAEGKLRIYRNHGTNTDPVFRGFQYLRSGREDASIPAT